MEARCQCGAVSFMTPTEHPLALYICHCYECRRQSSSAFGTSAIFPRFALPDDKPLSCYVRPTVSGASLYCYFCKNCGTRLLHATPGKNVVSVKGGCLKGLDWRTAIHIWTKTAMVPIPESCESHSEDADYTDGFSSGGRRGGCKRGADPRSDVFAAVEYMNNGEDDDDDDDTL
ncbi:Mss4-like protein [Niveomyces insectorum RCEF 264]|uniref:Mss4-like protein n=1 Tax=Niveomyces insectorum RCEF 264 TaxID=1081102 RepID=A0A168A480_9HYPO|nr:Mss4-like protein [Niveomyces insectorum RCEF 264]